MLGLVEKLNEVGGKLIVAGDKKGPASYEAQYYVLVAFPVCNSDRKL